MTQVTLQVLEGVERGRVYADLLTPLTIGREDENAIRLNDERVSRFHAKLQEDGGRIILTDLESTNGTRVNGHPVHMKVLRIGDQLTIGRSLLVFGSREEIAALTGKSDRPGSLASAETSDPTIAMPSGEATQPGDLSHQPVSDDDELGELFPDGAPDVPGELSPLQRAQVSDVLAYVHDRLRAALASGCEEANEAEGRDDGDARVMRLDWADWQRLVDLEMDLAVYLRSLTDPEG